MSSYFSSGKETFAFRHFLTFDHLLQIKHKLNNYNTCLIIIQIDICCCLLVNIIIIIIFLIVKIDFKTDKSNDQRQNKQNSNPNDNFVTSCMFRLNFTNNDAIKRYRKEILTSVLKQFT